MTPGSCAGPSDFLKKPNPKLNDSEFWVRRAPGRRWSGPRGGAGSPQAPVPGGARGCWDQAASLLLSTGAVRASSVFPILSVTLLFFGGLCVAASEFHRSRHNVILSAGIFFVSAGEPGPALTSAQTPPRARARPGPGSAAQVPPRKGKRTLGLLC